MKDTMAKDPVMSRTMLKVTRSKLNIFSYRLSLLVKFSAESILKTGFDI